VGEIHSGTLLTTPELRGGSAGNCPELGVNVDEEVGFSMVHNRNSSGFFIASSGPIG